MVEKTDITVEDFEAFVHLPEHREYRFELINGEIVEVPSNPFVSVIAGMILYAIRRWMETSGQSGYVTGEGGGFVIDGQVFAPDVAYTQKLPTNKGFEQVPPLLAVEVISDPHSNDEQTELRRKLGHYMRAGIQVWLVDYIARKVEVHITHKPVQIFAEHETLTGDDALPGFELLVKDIFPS